MVKLGLELRLGLGRGVGWIKCWGYNSKVKVRVMQCWDYILG